MRILYITRANLCLRRAHSHNIIATTALLHSINGVEVVLVSSGRHSCILGDVFLRHGVDTPLDFIQSKFLLGCIIRNRASFDVLYVRDPRLLIEVIAGRLLGKKVIFEIHGSHEWPGLRFLWKLIFRFASAHIFITKELQRYYRPTAKPHAVISCNSVDLKFFQDANTMLLDEKVKLPHSAFVALCLGSQEKYYDLRILISMMTHLPERVVLVLVGIKKDDISFLNRLAQSFNVWSRVFVLERVNYVDIPAYLARADVLLNPKVLGYPGSISSKLYEYLAAGKPIVASVVSADREVLSDENALLVEPRPEAFAAALKKLLDYPEVGARLATRAREDAKSYTRERRREQLASFLETL